MANNKTTKRALLSSTLALLMCLTMFIGTTFAWFTDSATTAVNKIQAGNLEVDLEMWNGEKWVSAEDQTLEFVKAANAPEKEAILWEPGCTYELPELRIVNKGDLALKYQVTISGINGDAKLNEAIEWTFKTPVGDWDSISGTMDPGYNSWESMLTPGGHSSLEISGHMKEEAGNEYQGLSIDSIAITVVATQYNYEYDSNGNTYDANAAYLSVWDGVTETAPKKINDVYHITNAAEFAQYINELNNNPQSKVHRYDSAKVVLDTDIDLAGAVLTASGEGYMFSGSFDGQGHTVSNFTVKREDGKLYTGLFSVYMCTDNGTATIKNLIVKNATVDSVGDQVAAIVPSVNDNSTVENCHAIDCVVNGVKKVGAVAGYAGNGATVKDCSAKGCTVTASNNASVNANLFGYANGGTFEGNADNGGNTLN